MSAFHVVARSGGFAVENESEVLAVCESREAAQMACDALNGSADAYALPRNAYDVFAAGRWTSREEAA